MPSRDEWRYLFSPSPAWVNTDQKSPLVGNCFTGQCAQCRWHQFGGYREPTCREVSEWLLWSGPSNPGTVQEMELGENHTLSSPGSSLKTADFSSSIELDHFIRAHVCRGIFLLSVLAYQSPHTFLFSSKNRIVIFLKTQTHEFLSDVIFQFFSHLFLRPSVVNKQLFFLFKKSSCYCSVPFIQ